MKKLITAKFTGLNGSLGFFNGQNYLLEISLANNSKTGKQEIEIENRGAGLATPEMICRYSNILTFLNNWDNIQDIRQ